ncbi:hypothetical protein Tco_0985371, partial [Tanacetum coccineum]
VELWVSAEEWICVMVSLGASDARWRRSSSRGVRRWRVTNSGVTPHGIFHLSDPAGVNLIRNCDQRGFHPHEEPDDGSPIYERCSHVYMNETLNFDVVDLR